MSLDQFNGQEVPTFLSGEIFENYYFVLNFSHCCQCSCFVFFSYFFGGVCGVLGFNGRQLSCKEDNYNDHYT